MTKNITHTCMKPTGSNNKTRVMFLIRKMLGFNINFILFKFQNFNKEAPLQ